MSDQPLRLKNRCPHCHVSLLGEPIPEPELSAQSPFGPFETHYRRQIGVEIPEVWDGILFWKCPDCGGTWHRFDLTAPQHYEAIRYMKQTRN